MNHFTGYSQGHNRHLDGHQNFSRAMEAGRKNSKKIKKQPDDFDEVVDEEENKTEGEKISEGAEFLSGEYD